MAVASTYVPRGSPSCLLHLWEAFQDQWVGLSQDPFKLVLLLWVSKCVRFCVCPLRVSFCFLPSSSSLVCRPCWPSKPGILRAYLPGVGPLVWRALWVAWTPWSLAKPLQSWWFSHLWVAYLGVWVLSIVYLHLSYLSHRGSFFYISSCGRSFLPVFMLFSLIVILYMVVILVCWQEEVSSRSSYSAILAMLWKSFFFFFKIWILKSQRMMKGAKAEERK